MWDKSVLHARRPESRWFQPRIGREFDLEEVHVINARTRGFLFRAITIGSGGAVAIASCYGLATGSYVAMELVWAVAGPMLGAMTTHYFGSTAKDM